MVVALNQPAVIKPLMGNEQASLRYTTLMDKPINIETDDYSELKVIVMPCYSVSVMNLGWNHHPLTGFAVC